MARAIADALSSGFSERELGRSLVEIWLSLEGSRAEAIECARLLLDADRLDEAAIVYSTLARRHPDDHVGNAGLAQVAMRRQLWSEALDRWNALITVFGRKLGPTLLAMRAKTLAELGLEEQAAEVYANLQRASPNEVAGSLGLAQLAMKQGDWARGLAAWSGLLARFPDNPNRALWRTSQALCLLRTGQAADAEEALRYDVKANPDDANAFQALLHLLIQTGRYQEAYKTLQESVFSTTDLPRIVDVRLTILPRLNRLAEARSEFHRQLASADDLELLAVLFSATPALFQGWMRTEAWITLRERTARIATTDLATRSHAANVLLLRLHLALRDHRKFLSAADAFGDRTFLGPQNRRLRAVAKALADPSYPDWRRPKIFGIGLSKTGTTSLTAALTRLGLSSIHFMNPITQEMMTDEDIYLFDAFTDTPVCVHFEKYYHLYPQSKFIYTTRPREEWLSSIARHWQRTWGLSSFKELKANMAMNERFHHGNAFRDIQRTLFFNHSSFEQAYDVYDARVRQFFANKPNGRFLELDMFSGDGWPKLTRFLGMAIPDAPFPWQNRDLTPEQF